MLFAIDYAEYIGMGIAFSLEWRVYLINLLLDRTDMAEFWRDFGLSLSTKLRSRIPLIFYTAEPIGELYHPGMKEEKGLSIIESFLKARIIRALSATPRYAFNRVAAFSAFIDAREFLKLREEIMRECGIIKVEIAKPIQLFLKETVPLVEAPAAWSHGFTGKSVRVAVLDTGVDWTHPALRGNVLEYSYMQEACQYIEDIFIYILALTLKNSGVPDEEIERAIEELLQKKEIAEILEFVKEPSCTAKDVDGHGTHVAGIVASKGEYRGVAPDAGILSIKLGSAVSTLRLLILIQTLLRKKLLTERDLKEIGRRLLLSFTDTLAYAIEQAARKNVDVISMSVGYPGSPDDLVCTIVDRVAEMGILVVAAAGNEGPLSGTVKAPAMARGAIAVGAVDKKGVLTSYSSRGPAPDGRTKPDILAPGGDLDDPVISTLSSTLAEERKAELDSRVVDSEYVGMTGTSMATPHVAGAAAILIQAVREQECSDKASVATMVKAALLGSAVDLGYDSNEQGHGLLNIRRALEGVYGVLGVKSIPEERYIVMLPEKKEEQASIEKGLGLSNSLLIGLGAGALAALIFGMLSSPRREAKEEGVKLAREAIEKRLQELRDEYAMGKISREEYLKLRTELEKFLDDLERRSF